MSSNPFHRAIYLTGATAVGKTAIGVALAQRINAEIIALDSMTLYRGLDIGTAKPSIEERGGVPHHLIDVRDPWQSASVADYQAWAETAITGIEARGHRVLLVGGTALYLKALLRGLFQGPAADPELRGTLEAEAAERGSAALHERLANLDPDSAARLPAGDRRRVIRALEVITLTGKPLSAQQVEHRRPAPAYVPVIALCRHREELYDRINRRVIRMFEDGFVQEVEGLLAGPRPIGPVASQAVGYREVIEMLRGQFDARETRARVQQRTRQFAKRQGTWFRSLAEVRPWLLQGDELPDQSADRLASLILTGSRLDRLG